MSVYMMGESNAETDEDSIDYEGMPGYAVLRVPQQLSGDQNSIAFDFTGGNDELISELFSMTNPDAQTTGSDVMTAYNNQPDNSD